MLLSMHFLNGSKMDDTLTLLLLGLLSNVALESVLDVLDKLLLIFTCEMKLTEHMFFTPNPFASFPGVILVLWTTFKDLNPLHMDVKIVNTILHIDPFNCFVDLFQDRVSVNKARSWLPFS